MTAVLHVGDGLYRKHVYSDEIHTVCTVCSGVCRTGRETDEISSEGFILFNGGEAVFVLRVI